MKFIITENQLNKLIESTGKVYYHGRTNSRPYNGKYIYITDSLEYASGYSRGDELYMYSIPFDESKIFTIKNPKHKRILKKALPAPEYNSIINSIGSTGEIDWSSMSYIYNDEKELYGEEVIEDLGFKGIKLQERPKVECILIFNQENINFIGKLDISDEEHRKKIGDYISSFIKDHNLL